MSSCFTNGYETLWVLNDLGLRCTCGGLKAISERSVGLVQGWSSGKDTCLFSWSAEGHVFNPRVKNMPTFPWGLLFPYLLYDLGLPLPTYLVLDVIIWVYVESDLRWGEDYKRQVKVVDCSLLHTCMHGLLVGQLLCSNVLVSWITLQTSYHGMQWEQNFEKKGDNTIELTICLFLIWVNNCTKKNV